MNNTALGTCFNRPFSKLGGLGTIFQDFPKFPTASFENVSIEFQHEPIMAPVCSRLLCHYAYINETCISRKIARV